MTITGLNATIKQQLSSGICGGIAQLARAPALQAGGQRFESAYLHQIYTLVRDEHLFNCFSYRGIAQLVRARA